MDILAVFRSRSEAIRFSNLLSERHIANTVINTPSYLKLGCGLSVLFSSSLRDTAYLLIKEGKFKSFINFYAR